VNIGLPSMGMSVKRASEARDGPGRAILDDLVVFLFTDIPMDGR